MSEDVWILGIHMTKFGKHPDKDVVDLGAEAARAALGDAVFDEAYARGAALSLGETASLALAVEHPDLAVDSSRFAELPSGS